MARGEGKTEQLLEAVLAQTQERKAVVYSSHRSGSVRLMRRAVEMLEGEPGVVVEWGAMRLRFRDGREVYFRTSSHRSRRAMAGMGPHAAFRDVDA